jgi:hypothetical protein
MAVKKGHHRRPEKHPGRRFWYQQGFVEEFPEILIGLEDGRPLSALFHGDNEVAQKR